MLICLFSLHSPLRLHHPGTRLSLHLSLHVLLHLLFPISLICCLSLTVPVSPLARLLPSQAAEFLEPGWEERWGLCWGDIRHHPTQGRTRNQGPPSLGVQVLSPCLLNVSLTSVPVQFRLVQASRQHGAVCDWLSGCTQVGLVQQT